MMIEYNYLELLKALRICASKPHYYVGVYAPTIERAKSALEDAYKAAMDDDEEAPALQRHLSSAVEQLLLFKNGSYLRCVRAHESSRGNRFHHILYMDGINHDVLRVLVKPTLIRYMEENNGTSG